MMGDATERHRKLAKLARRLAGMTTDKEISRILTDIALEHEARALELEILDPDAEPLLVE